MTCSLDALQAQRPRATLARKLVALHRFSPYMACACMAGLLLGACIGSFSVRDFFVNLAESLHR